MQLWESRINKYYIWWYWRANEPANSNRIPRYESIIKEIVDRKKEKTKHHEERLQALIIKKTNDDIKNLQTKKTAAKLLMGSLGN